MSMTIDGRINGYGALDPLQTSGSTPAPVSPSDADTIPEAPVAGKTESDGIPALSQPKGMPDFSGLTGGVPSLGANVLALVGDLADEQRRANNEQRFQQSQMIVSKLHDQASTIRTQAVLNLTMGLVSAGIQFAASTYTIGATTKALALEPRSNSVPDKLVHAAQMTMRNTKIQSFSQAIGSAGNAMTSAKEFTSAMFDAEMKDRDAQIEMIRAYLTQLDSLKQSLEEVIRKATQTQDEIQQSTNQTRVKILT